ncbi:ferrous iron transport protein A [Candidatus Bathyarchaeota archaeon]|nr:ferrous iron transport protein A [Candidatus Bathyarchaeota archaeon]RJS69292.1 MAG: ferrous iron transport protein A [Candidatus Bathyarchaeota archaeon]RLI16043.1 MAG: iron transporter [Candidatus Bathyarchaeota archaeon]
MEKRLSELKPGEKGIILRVEGSGATKRRILDMGLVRGTEIKVIRRAPLGDPVEFLLKGYNLSLRKSEGDNVYVRVVEEGEK